MGQFVLVFLFRVLQDLRDIMNELHLVFSFITIRSTQAFPFTHFHPMNFQRIYSRETLSKKNIVQSGNELR